jgi:4-amino-4-deoxy-L-arabinose transferase-like glycosyltransferase
LLLKTTGSNARLNRLNSTAPIRSRAAEEGNFQIPLWGVPLILFLLYVCLFSGLGALGLVGADEPRYAAIARAMADTHDWITPRLWGTPWFEKPVLYYWTAGIAMRIFGVSEFAARLPSALAALLAVIAVAWTGLRSYGLGTAWYSLLMLPTSVAMIGFSRGAGPDMLFAGLLTAAMAVASEMLQKPRPGPILRIAFGFFLGAAVLAKGPAAVILAGGATLLWAALSQQWRAPFRFLHPLIIAVFCATALPWYILCARRNPDFLRVFIWQHNFERYLTPVFEHRQPFWYFGPIFLLGILPWLPLLIHTPFDVGRNMHIGARKDSPALFIACWALFTLLFFSLSQSKLPGYILPAIPPAIFLVAAGVVRQINQKSRGASLSIAVVGGLFPLLLGIVRAQTGRIFAFPDTFIPDPIRVIQFGLVLSVVGGGLIVAFGLFRKWDGAICTSACTIAILLLVANRAFLPAVDASISARPAASWAIASRLLEPKNENVYWLPATFSFPLHSLGPDDVRVFRLPRAYLYGLNYYYNTNLSEWTPGDVKVGVLFCGKEAIDSPQLDNVSDVEKIPVTGDGKIFAVIFHPKAQF